MQLVSIAPPTARSNLHSGLAALLLWGVTAASAINLQAQALFSPAGTWDFILSGGGQKGIAFITFADDQSFSGYQILSTSPRSASSTGGRNVGGDLGRGIELSGDTSSTNLVASTNLFGFGRITGPWAYDAKGNVIGNFTQVIDAGTGSNEGIVDGVSFSAKVVPGKRLTLVASTSNGKVTYKGVPYNAGLTRIDGTWYGMKKLKGRNFTEFYSFNSLADLNPFLGTDPDLSQYPGIYYTVDGEGPGYEVKGFSMLSTQKKIAFSFQSFNGGGTDGVLNASFGTFSNPKGVPKASTSGIEFPNNGITYNFAQPLSPPSGN
jgi:hypothetical protein